MLHMNNNNQRALCQQLWARKQIPRLSHSSNIYNEIRQYLKNEEVDVSQVQEMIDRAARFQNTGVRFATLFSIFGAILKNKPALTSARTICSCWIAIALVKLPRRTWLLRREICLNDTQMHICNILPCWKETPMRLWRWGFDFTTSPSSAFGATSRMLCPSWQWLGQKACDGWLCLYPLALSSLCLSWLDHGGDDWPWLQSQSGVAG